MPQSDPVDPEPVEPAISDIERLLCGPVAEGMLEQLQPRDGDAWRMRLTGLDRILAPDGGTGPVRICIATEQITGPVRNGGIGSTYANLSLMLARHGFDVTVLYLRGSQVETETIEYWVDHYAARGVKLVPATDYAEADRFATGADRWLRVPYNMLRWLIDHPMDVVHVSEWRGTGYLCLLAKRQGWAFGETLFVVKTSSPWMWNRLYGGHMLDRADDLVKIHAERRSVELADLVVGGSLHLLRWMASQGYALPRPRAFVQPNVVTFTTLEPLMKGRSPVHGQRTPIDEFVFFGRLEVRKGLFIFCQAIRRLVRKGVTLPKRITFMGKPGGRLPSHPDMETPDYIREVSENWPCEIRILTGFQQYEAIEYLLGGQRLAVMPSIIENSSMAIYEAAICGIPTVATDVGGNAELIDAGDHGAVLCQPHPVSLGDKLEEALELGGMVPRPSFDNNANLETWMNFHRQLGGDLRNQLLEQCRPPVVAAPTPATSACIYYMGHATALDTTLASLAAQNHAPREVLVGVDADSNLDCDAAAAALARHGFAPRVYECFDLDAGSAFNRLAEHAQGDHLLFLWEGGKLEPDALVTLERIAGATGAAVLNYLTRVCELGSDDQPALSGQFVVGVSDAFFRSDPREMPLFVRRQAFAGLNGFTTDYRVLGHEAEFVAKAQLAGIVCQTVPMQLGSILAPPMDWLRSRGYDLSAGAFRAIRPKLAAAPLAMRDSLLLARGMQARGPASTRGRNDGANPEGVLMRILAGLKPDGPGTNARSAKSASAAGTIPDVKAPTRNIEFRSGPANGESADIRAGLPLAAAGRIEGPTGSRPYPMSAALRAMIARGDLREHKHGVGQVLGVFANRVYGWAAEPGGERQAVEVELIVDGDRHILLADRAFAPYAALPPEAMRTGFVFDLPRGSARRKTGTAYRVAAAAGELVIGGGIAMPRAATAIGMGIDGGVEASRDGIVRGWVRHVTDAMRRIELAIFVNGAFLGRIVSDPAEGGRFAFVLPELLRDVGRHQIDIVVAESGLSLPGGGLWIEHERIAPARVGLWGIFGL